MSESRRQSGSLRLAAARVVAVIRAPTPETALSTADAVLEGGIRAIEITYSTPKAPRVIAELQRRHGAEALIGAGTVRRASEVPPAMDAGAQFIVSPGVDSEVIDEAAGRGATVLAGALTPTEIMRAVALGADAVKLFPAFLGGAGLLRALRDPFRLRGFRCYPDVAFVPTGGVTTANVGEWFAAGAIAVAVGSSLCPRADNPGAGGAVRLHPSRIPERGRESRLAPHRASRPRRRATWGRVARAPPLPTGRRGLLPVRSTR